MNLYEEVRAVCLYNAAIEDSISDYGGINARFWSEWPRTYQVPCIVMEMGIDQEQNDLSGNVGLIVTPSTITCRANTPDEAKALSDLLRSTLAGYAGVFDAILDETATVTVPKSEGSADAFCDRVMSFTMIRTE